jgi:hypothetical protein
VLIPSALIGVFVGIAQKKSIAIFERKEPSGFCSVIVSFCPLAFTPDAVAALPSATACAPRIPLAPVMNGTAGDCIFGFRSRLNAAAKFAAVRVWPVFDRQPDLIVNVYVFPSFDTDGNPTAASGTSLVPATPGLSG